MIGVCVNAAVGFATPNGTEQYRRSARNANVINAGERGMKPVWPATNRRSPRHA